MVRAFLLATLALFVSQAPSAPPGSVLHVTVVLVDATGRRRRCRAMRC